MRVAKRWLAAKYDPFRLQTPEDVLSTHLYTVHPTEDDLSRDVRGDYTAKTALLKRARAWSLDKFVDHMERHAWNNRIEELRSSLVENPLLYMVRVKGRTKDRGNTFEKDIPRLREHLQEFYKYEKWADQWELVVKPRPKSDYRRLEDLEAMRKERERAWAKLYKELRDLKPEIKVEHSSGYAIHILVFDQDVAVGGIMAEYIERTDFNRIPALKGEIVLSGGCWEDIQKLAGQFGDGEVWSIPKATLWPEYRGKGIGFDLYEKVVSMLKGMRGPVYLEAHECLRNQWGTMGATSPDAHRVWKKLVTRYPSSGTVIAVV